MYQGKEKLPTTKKSSSCDKSQTDVQILQENCFYDAYRYYINLTYKNKSQQTVQISRGFLSESSALQATFCECTATGQLVKPRACARCCSIGFWLRSDHRRGILITAHAVQRDFTYSPYPTFLNIHLQSTMARCYR